MTRASGPRGRRADRTDRPYAGRVEVRLLRRLPAEPARLRGRAAELWPAPSTSPISPRCRGPRSRDPTTSRWWRARSPPRPMPDRIREVRASSRRLVTIGACATAGGIQGLRNFAASGEYAADRLRPSRVHRLARHLHSDLRPRRRGLRASRLPDRPPPAARGDHRHPGRATPVIPGHSVCQECKGRGTVCLLVSRGHRLPGPGDPDRVRRPVPRRRPRMLRLLRAGRHRQHGLAGRPAAPPGHGTGRGVAAVPHLQRRRPGLPRRVRGPGRFAPGRPRTSPSGPTARRRTHEPRVAARRASSASRVCRGSRGRARCGWRSTTARSPTSPSRSSSRRATSRPCSSGGTSPRLRTSRPASAASARSPTR